jgi:hypothetical protein
VSGLFASGRDPLPDNEAVAEASTQLHRFARVSSTSVPAGIYGTVICASILASASPETPAVKVAVTVIVTLLVYWLAERYAEVLGLEPSAGHAGLYERHTHRITAAHVRGVMRSGWPMIQASVTPLIVLLGGRLLGAGSEAAVNIALAYTMVLLLVLGWLAATRAGLARWPRLLAAAFATLLGLVVVILKASLH